MTKTLCVTEAKADRGWRCDRKEGGVMGSHIIDGEFQSDKYPTTPRGKVPLSVKDKSAQDLLWEYAQRRRAVDAEFADDLEAVLKAAGVGGAPWGGTAVAGPAGGLCRVVIREHVSSGGSD